MESPFLCRLEYFCVPQYRQYPWLLSMECRILFLSHQISPLSSVPGSLLQWEASQTKGRLGAVVPSHQPAQLIDSRAVSLNYSWVGFAFWNFPVGFMPWPWAFKTNGLSNSLPLLPFLGLEMSQRWLWLKGFHMGRWGTNIRAKHLHRSCLAFRMLRPILWPQTNWLALILSIMWHSCLRFIALKPERNPRL